MENLILMKTQSSAQTRTWTLDSDLGFVNFETVTMHELDQEVENSKIRKENIEYLTDNRRQISCSNYSNENYCGNLMTRIKETEIKVLKSWKVFVYYKWAYKIHTRT